jgi:hypothetical protein
MTSITDSFFFRVPLFTFLKLNIKLGQSCHFSAMFNTFYLNESKTRETTKKTI